MVYASGKTVRFHWKSAYIGKGRVAIFATRLWCYTVNWRKWVQFCGAGRCVGAATEESLPGMEVESAGPCRGRSFLAPTRKEPKNRLGKALTHCSRNASRPPQDPSRGAFIACAGIHFTSIELQRSQDRCSFYITRKRVDFRAKTYRYSNSLIDYLI